MTEGKRLSEDEELEYLKRKRLLDIKRRLLTEKAEEVQKEKVTEVQQKTPKDALKTVFDDSAWKIWRTAEHQYPQATEEVAKALATLIEAGKLRTRITGEQIYWLFMQLGLRVKIETKIRILERGELKTIADKLREK